MIYPRRGQVWIAQFDPIRGYEQAKTRPCIIVSVDEFNTNSSKLVIVVPVTSKLKKPYASITISPPEGGLKEVSYVLCEQIRVLSLDRFSNKPIGTVHPRTLYNIERALSILLGIKLEFPEISEY